MKIKPFLESPLEAVILDKPAWLSADVYCSCCNGRPICMPVITIRESYRARPSGLQAKSRVPKQN